MYGTEPWYNNVTMKIYLVTRAQNLSSYYTETTITVKVPHNQKLQVIRPAFSVISFCLILLILVNTYMLFAVWEIRMENSNFCARGLGIHHCLTLYNIFTFHVVNNTIKVVAKNLKSHLSWEFCNGPYLGSTSDNLDRWSVHDQPIRFNNLGFQTAEKFNFFHWIVICRFHI